MSKKLTALFAGVVASLALAAGTMQGCGSSGGSGDFKTECLDGCNKAIACAGDADAATITQLRMYCTQACNSAPTNCTNNAARVSAAKACLAMSDCTAFQNCGTSIPACQTTTGTGGGGGSTGRGGSTGTGGGGGTSGGGWTCSDNGQACACVQGSSGSGPTSCPTTYNCCFSFDANGMPACSCATTATSADCTTLAQAFTGTISATCP